MEAMSESVTTTETFPTIATIANLAAHEGQTVTLRGWLYNMRESGKLLFPIFRDGSGTIQGIVPKAAVAPEVFDRIKGLTQESSVIVTGKVRADSRAPSGFELDVENLEVVQQVSGETPFPISLKEHGVDFLMEHRHLWIRTPRQSAILRVRATIMRAAAEYFDTNGFTRTDPPILTPNACEGTSELFEMDYFGDDKAYLTQSGQLYIEATALALGKVYSFGPTFRAEKSKTRRHLTEFWMIEPEVAYIGLDELMVLAENFISHIVARVLESHRADLKVIGRDVEKLEKIKAPFPKISYEEAHAMLAEAFAKGLIETEHKDGDDFGSPDETYISNQFDRPVMVHRYPAAIKAFYMQPDPQRRVEGAVRRRAGAGGIRRDHRRIAACGQLRPAEGPHRGARAAAGRLPVVPGPAPLWLGAARRIRHGHRTGGGVDLRARPRAGDDPVCADAEPDLSVVLFVKPRGPVRVGWAPPLPYLGRKI